MTMRKKVKGPMDVWEMQEQMTLHLKTLIKSQNVKITASDNPILLTLDW